MSTGDITRTLLCGASTKGFSKYNCDISSLTLKDSHTLLTS